jgi:predicted Rossmann fold flavoprotein
LSRSAPFFDTIILGGGAAGLMCAAVAGRGGRRVLVLENNDRVGRKIEISGGGRCNFTNVGAAPECYLSQNPDFCRSALARYTPWDFLALVEQHGIRYHEKTLGQQFCDGSSRQIIDLLVAECTAVGVQIRCSARVVEVEKSDRFRLRMADGDVLECETLVVATGGLSFPKLGATDFGYRIARQFGLGITELRPGLVPLTFQPNEQPLTALAGVSLPVVARAGRGVFKEAMLVTHRGVSGPAILQVSSYWRDRESVLVDLWPEGGLEPALQSGRDARREWIPLLAESWPRRWAELWVPREAPGKPLERCRNTDLAEFAERVHRWSFIPAGTEGYPKAEVTVGGVDTTELSSKTMESRSVRGLFFIGEVADVTGWLGGYNFQWAWASAAAAGEALAAH